MSLYEQFQKQKSASSPSTSGGLYAKFLEETKKANEPKVGLLGTLKNTITNSNYWQGGQQAVDSTLANKAPTSTKLVGQGSGINTFFGTIGDSLTDLYNRSQNANPFQKHTVAGAIAGVGEGLMGVVNVPASIITGALKGLETVPGVGKIANDINAIMASIGGGASQVGTESIVQNMPLLSQETKDTLKPFLGELSAFGAQLLVGKGGADLVGIVKAKATDIAAKINQDVTRTIPVQTTEIAPTPVKINTSSTRRDAYYKEQGYEPITPAEKLPVIDYGTAPKIKDTSGLPVIDAGLTKVPKVQKLGEYTVEPLKEPVPTAVPTMTPSPFTPRQDIIKPTPAPNFSVAPIAKEIAPVNVTGGKISGVAKSIEAKAVEKGLTEHFGELAGYDPITIKDQAARAAKLMSDNIKNAEQMVLGKIPMEPGLRPEMLLKSMEDHATSTGNVSLSMKIAKSPLVSATSSLGQGLRVLAERSKESVVSMIKEIQKSRESVVEKYKKGTVKEIKKSEAGKIRAEIKKKPINKQDWSSFVESIPKC
jgi:hypothetical protein